MLLLQEKKEHLEVIVFVQHTQRLYRHVYLACREENNGCSHYQALFTLLAVLSVELVNEEVLVDLIQLVLALQVGTAPQIYNPNSQEVEMLCTM